jgi:hypothetical protein
MGASNEDADAAGCYTALYPVERVGGLATNPAGQTHHNNSNVFL